MFTALHHVALFHRDPLDLLAERPVQTTHTRRRAIRLRRMQEVTVSPLRSAAVPDLLKGISAGVISLGPDVLDRNGAPRRVGGVRRQSVSHSLNVSAIVVAAASGPP